MRALTRPPDIEVLYMHHQRLCICLAKRVKNWELFAEKGIGDIILHEVTHPSLAVVMMMHDA